MNNYCWWCQTSEDATDGKCRQCGAPLYPQSGTVTTAPKSIITASFFFEALGILLFVIVVTALTVEKAGEAEYKNRQAATQATATPSPSPSPSPSPKHQQARRSSPTTKTTPPLRDEKEQAPSPDIPPETAPSTKISPTPAPKQTSNSNVQTQPTP